MDGSISGISEDTEDHFDAKMRQIIKHYVIFNNQTERIAVIAHKFVAENQPYLRKCGML